MRPWQPHDGEVDGTVQDRFADHVMQAIAHAPQPSPTRTFLEGIHLRSVRTAASALIVAWHLGTVRTWPIAPRVRARSLALVMAVAFVFGSATLAAAAAVSVVAPPWMEQTRMIDAPAALPSMPSVGSGMQSASPPTPDPSPAPAVVRPTDRPNGGTGIAPAAHPTAGSADDGRDEATDSHDGDGSASGDDHASAGDDPADGVDDGDHATTDDHASETPEPDDHGTSGDGEDGGSSSEDSRDDGSDSGG